MDPELNHDIAETPSEEEIESLKDEEGPEGQDYSEEIKGALGITRDYEKTVNKETKGDKE